eukprot:6637610-Prymnesium_polylepis.1
MQSASVSQTRSLDPHGSRARPPRSATLTAPETKERITCYPLYVPRGASTACMTHVRPQMEDTATA